MPAGSCRATPLAGGRLTARHDRALTVLTAGIAITIFLAIYVGLASRNSRQLALANRRVLELAQTDILTGVCTENLSSGVVVVKSAKDGV